MSVPKCVCTIKYDVSDGKYPAKVIGMYVTVMCPLHKQAPELFEIVESFVNGNEQVIHHSACRCLHCRAIRVLFKVRGLKPPERETLEALKSKGGI